MAFPDGMTNLVTSDTSTYDTLSIHMSWTDPDWGGDLLGIEIFGDSIEGGSTLVMNGVEEYTDYNVIELTTYDYVLKPLSWDSKYGNASYASCNMGILGVTITYCGNKNVFDDIELEWTQHSSVVYSTSIYKLAFNAFGEVISNWAFYANAGGSAGPYTDYDVDYTKNYSYKIQNNGKAGTGSSPFSNIVTKIYVTPFESDNNHTLFIHGRDTKFSSIPLHTLTSEPINTNTTLFTEGKQYWADRLLLYITGSIASNGSTTLFVKGHIRKIKVASLYVRGADFSNLGRYLFISGGPNTASIPLFIQNGGFAQPSNSNITLFTDGAGVNTGFSVHTDSIYLYIQQGQNGVSNQIPLYTYGWDTLNSFIDLHTISQETSTLAATMYVKGWQIVPINSYIPLFVNGGVSGAITLVMSNVYDVSSSYIPLTVRNNVVALNTYSPLYTRGTIGNFDMQVGIPLTMMSDLNPVSKTFYLYIQNDQSHIDLTVTAPLFIDGTLYTSNANITLVLYNNYLSSSMPLSVKADGMWDGYIPLTENIPLVIWRPNLVEVIPLFCKALDNPTNSYFTMYARGSDTLNGNIPLSLPKGSALLNNSVYLTCVHNGGSPNAYTYLTTFGAYLLNGSIPLALPNNYDIIEPIVLLYINGY